MDGYQIRCATQDDLLRIRDWLMQEHDESGESFLANYDLIEEGQQNAELTVLIRNSDDSPVAFYVGREAEILAVKADCRGQGLGRALLGSTLHRRSTETRCDWFAR